jgi:hypothetical protein
MKETFIYGLDKQAGDFKQDLLYLDYGFHP